MSILIKKDGYEFIPNPKFLRKIAKEDRKSWHDALVSGNYPQGKGLLFMPTEKTFCCLGVYCHYVEKISLDKLEYVNYPWKIQGGYSALEEDPAITKEKSSIDDDTLAREVTATWVNDEYNLSFKEIAMLIYPENYEQEDNINSE